MGFYVQTMVTNHAVLGVSTNEVALRPICLQFDHSNSRMEDFNSRVASVCPTIRGNGTVADKICDEQIIQKMLPVIVGFSRQQYILY